MTVKSNLIAMYSVAVSARIHWSKVLFDIKQMPMVTSVILASALLAGCSVLPDKPQRATLFDFGTDLVAPQATGSQAQLPAVAIDDIATSGGLLDNSAVLYRLTYEDAQELRAYSLSRWTMPAAQLVRQRLRDRLSLSRPVYNARESLALNRSQNAVLPLQIRLELQDFSHVFSAPGVSVGLIRLRATLVEVTPAGEKLINQRYFVVQRPAPSADAQGGVRALTAATDAAIVEIEQWLQDSSKR